MSRLSPGQRWVVALGGFAVLLLVVGLVGIVVGVVHASAVCGDDEYTVPCPGDTSGVLWGGVLAVLGLLHLGLTGLAGAVVWSTTPTIAPRPARRPRIEPDGPHRVFSYGTLQQSTVQDALFDGVVRTEPDSLPGWRIDHVTITDPEVVRTSGSDRHPILRRGTAEDRVDGAVLVLGFAWQLEAVDAYEVADYRRIEVTLASGTTAWVYVAADQV
ncbi:MULTISPECIES: gamma-glutamylcyclotransferase family protein [unclassified Curtobacterium]|uniref:gamma-glutamylcyclotransferase family protein n=1 Tax=unclassified Curtobacterium TaxID=257496 RepID=UPI000B1C58B2|nr:MULTISPECIES: gamma-glutamylcyclotransferase family protein [unclassified Curtobacterium]